MKTMEKKMYMSPVAEVLEIKGQELLAGSVTDEGNVIIDDPVPGDAGGAAAPVNDLMRLFWTLLLLVTLTLTAGAQATTTVEPADAPADGRKHGMKLYLKDNTTVEYPLTAIDHVTYLPGIGMKVYLKGETYSFDYLFSQMTKIEYMEDGNTNANSEVVEALQTYCPEAWRLEYPQVSYSNLAATKDGADTKNQIIVKSTSDYGITYSLEWDNAKIANRWTCYELHAGNTLSTTDRNDDFKADPEVAVSAQLSDYKNSGFSRGHLCPSADRQCSVDQNKQTFYLTNMQPQWQEHNGGLWKNLEDLVRNYATDDTYSDAHCDTLYIVKAATIADVAADALTNNSTAGTYTTEEVNAIQTPTEYDKRLIVPRYFYMALLHYNKATDTYKAIAFWTKHLKEGDTNKNFGDYAISIDKLEELTGIDFFCNLPDAIEAEVEATADLDFWKLSTTP